MKGKAIGLLGLVCLAFSATAIAATENKAPLTDPNLLQAMGFPADATNVYVSLNPVKVANDGAATNADFGTLTRYTSMAPKSWSGRQSTAATPWEYSGGAADCCTNVTRTGPETFADAPINLPDGVQVTGARFWVHDTDSAGGANIFFYIFESCYPTTSAGAPVTTLLNTNLQSFGGAGYQSDFEGFTFTVDNQRCVYTARAEFPVLGLTLQKLRFQWNRVIAPAPAVATFTDVPTSHPFFREIQALYASGVTLGCGGSTFCPSQAVTRDQMAAFLARALGL